MGPGGILRKSHTFYELLHPEGKADRAKFAENGEFMWGSIAAAIAMDANKKGLLPSADLTSLSSDEAQKLRPRLQYMVGSNSRCKAIRGRKLLGWEPKERRLIDEVPDIVDGEAKSMGLIKGHAEKIRL